jgi:hypothetical protein
MSITEMTISPEINAIYTIVSGFIPKTKNATTHKTAFNASING